MSFERGQWFPNLRDFLELTEGTSKLDRETRLCCLGDMSKQTMLQFHENLRNDFQLPNNWAVHNSRLLQLDVLEFWSSRI